jgi:hypothetical protein
VIGATELSNVESGKNTVSEMEISGTTLIQEETVLPLFGNCHLSEIGKKKVNIFSFVSK